MAIYMDGYLNFIPFDTALMARRLKSCSQDDMQFPFYGDTLDDLTEVASPADAAKIVINGDNADAQETQWKHRIRKECWISLRAVAKN